MKAPIWWLALVVALAAPAASQRLVASDITATTTTAAAAAASSQATSSSDSHETAATQTEPTTSGRPTAQFQFIKPVVSQPKCQYNNQTYLVGDTWTEDCLYRCECVAPVDGGPQAVSACRDRCPTFSDAIGNCRMVRSKLDQCCLELLCDSTPLATTTVMNTERGELNVTTTDIALPTSLQPATTTTTTTQAPAPPQTTYRVSPRDAQTSGSQQQVPTTLAASSTTTPRRLPPATVVTTAAAAAFTTTTTTSPNLVGPTASRQPKQVNALPQTTKPAPSNTQRPLQKLPLASTATTSRAPAELTSRIMLNDDAAASQPDGQPTTTATNYNANPYLESGSNEPDLPADEANPSELDLCIVDVNSTEAYKVNMDWLQEPCQVRCRCVFRSSQRDSMMVSVLPTVNLKEPRPTPTEIRCELPTGCYGLLERLRPTPECPMPRLLQRTTTDHCACPEVGCFNQPPQVANTARVQHLTPTTRAPPQTSIITTTTTESTPASSRLPPVAVASCQWADRLLKTGESVNDECHASCICQASGKLSCKPLVCPQKPPEGVECDDWKQVRPNLVRGECCPRFVCNKQQAPATTTPATTTTTTTTTTSTTTTAAPTFRPCLVFDQIVAHGEQVPDQIQPREGGACDKICTCSNGQLECAPRPCQELGDQPPKELGCGPDMAVRLAPQETGCCAAWACLSPVLLDFHVEPLNATQVEVSFTIPAQLVNSTGRAELNYTSLPDSQWSGEQPPPNARWLQKPNIRTSNGLFNHDTIKYRMGNLKPAHRYWFGLRVIFDGSDELESDLLTLVMPSIPPSSTTTPSTAPTTPATSPMSSSPSTITSTEKPQTSSSTTTTTTTNQPPLPPLTNKNDTYIPKPALDEIDTQQLPCSRGLNHTDNQIPESAGSTLPMNQFNEHITGYVQKYAWSLLLALIVMTLLFIIMSFLYLKKTTHVIAPITSQSAYDNPSFTKLVSYYANKPHVLLVDETGQNYNNDAILAKQKNLEVDQSSPLHQHHFHQVGDIHHHNGRQHLI